MSSTNKTTNYNLSQFVGTDIPSYLGDYNSDMSKIDKAIGDVANSQGSVEQSVVGLTAEVQGLSTQVSGVSTSVQQLQTSVAQIDSGYKQADTTLSQRITTNANNIQTNTTAIEGINTTIGTDDISGIGNGTIKGAISNLNSSLNRNKIRNLLLPNGEYIYQGLLYVVNNEYACFTINLPYAVDTSEISVIEFRPGGQTGIYDNNPNVSVNGNQILLLTHESVFLNYNCKECVAKININIQS